MDIMNMLHYSPLCLIVLILILYRVQRHREATKLRRLMSDVFGSSMPKSVVVMNRLFAVGAVQRLLRTSRGRKVILYVLQDTYGWIAYQIALTIFTSSLMPRPDNSVRDSLRSCFKTDI